MKHVLKDYPNLKVKRTFGRMMIELNGVNEKPILEKLKTIFGIHSFSLALKVDNELDEMKKAH